MVGIFLLGRVIDSQTFEQLMAFDPLGVGLVLARNDQKEASCRRLQQGDLVDAVDDMKFNQLSLLAVADRVSQHDPSTVVLTLRRAAEDPGRQVGKNAELMLN
eukprot:Skav211856  [mRNA]  locus=scaffold1622:180018:182007:- [translate_table: standard]